MTSIDRRAAYRCAAETSRDVAELTGRSSRIGGTPRSGKAFARSLAVLAEALEDSANSDDDPDADVDARGRDRGVPA